MTPDQVKAALYKLPIQNFGPVDVIVFKHEHRDILRISLRVLQFWDLVCEDFSQLKRFRGSNGICSLYGNSEIFPPLQIRCVLSAEFKDGKMIEVHAVMLVTGSSQPDAQTCLDTLANYFLESFRASLAARHPDKEINTFIKA